MHPAANVAASAADAPTAVAAKAAPTDGAEASPFLPTLSAYGLSRVTGFLPELPPLARLPEGYFTPWETTLDRLHGLLLTDRFRAEIDARFPHLDPARLDTHDVPLMRRAFVVLSLLASAYVWGRHATPSAKAVHPDPRRVLPPQLAVPLTHVSSVLGLRPIVCYAGLDLWNWTPVDPADGCHLDNLTTLHTFSGTMDEAWFYLIPVGIEAKGAPSLAWMCDAWRAIAQGDHHTVAQIVARFAALVKGHGQCGHRVLRSGADHAQRARHVPAANFTTVLRARGGNDLSALDQTSAGPDSRSPMIQALDVFFGIEHRPTGKGPGPNFIPEMREYMPREHRAFLDDAQFRAPSLRDFVANSQHEGLVEAFNAAVAELRAFRTAHLNMVARFIIVPAHQHAARAGTSPPKRVRSTPGSPARNAIVMPQVQSPTKAAEATPGMRGTGGTQLMPFLKQARDETDAAVVPQLPRQLNGRTDGN
ncbi:hypothetical protein AMAG_17393 [Allomyces macrogynus ATCC 38327]|uniref:Indoleamine 2,3-dioxygenase n=1 Tax=Allomyces macrogynus (strain ATCC 38327) TaxID=578462 RepID=A0A0L0TF34_ALLM3|nr:hypothetical protein AMAG_17393 [Allomyces macrogynus ATCC 38327]|eukprot:KNE73204.1 hypothetical protein AMAG_17393 [Allomyces macrogynus ATCC 38327]